VTLPVVVAIPGPSEARLLSGWEPLRRELVVVRRCADVTDVLSVAVAGLARAVVLGADLPGCDTETVDSLRRSGVGLLVLLPDGAASEPAERRWRGLGATRFVPATASAADVARAVALSVTTSSAEPLDAVDPVEPVPFELGPARGRRIAVWGPYGSVGRTTVAVNLAAELAAEHESVLLIDADTRGASVGQHLGLLDESPGLLAAVRAAAEGRLGTASLARHTPRVGPGLTVLSGSSDPSRWGEVRAAAFRRVLEVAGAAHDWTVIDLGGGSDDLPDGGGRDLATSVALEAADLVLLVGAGDPVGLQRLARTWTHLPESLAGVQLLPVVNRVRPASLGGSAARATNALLRRVAGIENAVLIPHDDAVDSALLAGRTLAEHRPRAVARRALLELTRRVEAQVDLPEELSEASASSGFDPLLARS